MVHALGSDSVRVALCSVVLCWVALHCIALLELVLHVKVDVCLFACFSRRAHFYYDDAKRATGAR